LSRIIPTGLGRTMVLPPFDTEILTEMLVRMIQDYDCCGK
jgi:hypothetical protein